MKQRVALVASPLGGPASQVHPIGAMAVGSYLKAHMEGAVEVEIFNCGSSEASRLSARDAIRRFRPTIVGFPIYSGHVKEVAAWAGLLRRDFPAAIFVAGGPHVTLTVEHFLPRWGHVFDYAICGDGERPLLALTAAAADGDVAACHGAPGLTRMDGGRLCANPPDVLPVDSWVDPFLCKVVDDGEPLQFTDRRDRRIRSAVALVSSRSCPQQCSFCAIVAMPGKWRAAPTDQLVDWLCGEMARNAFEHIYFLDANFFVSPRRVRELVAALAARLPGVTWSTSSTVGYLLRMDADMPWLVENGLRAMELGLESGSEQQLRFLNKIATVEKNVEAVALVQRHGLDLGLDFIMFYPDQSPELLRQNLSFLQRAQLLDEEQFGHYLTGLELYPGTPLRELYETRRGSPFDPDELPSIESLFVDDRMRSIHRLFVHQFAPRYLWRITDTIKRLSREAVVMRQTDPKGAQARRLEVMLLKHVPFKLLWRLCDRPWSASVEEAWPWLASFDASSASIRALVWEQPEEREVEAA